MTNENMNYEEMTPEFEPDYEPEFEETCQPNTTIFKCHITNGFDTLDFETNDFNAFLDYSEAAKIHLQGFQQYITKPQTPQTTPPQTPSMPTQNISAPVQRYTQPQQITGEPVSPKQRKILKEHGYTDFQINAMNKQQAIECVKKIIER